MKGDFMGEEQSVTLEAKPPLAELHSKLRGCALASRAVRLRMNNPLHGIGAGLDCEITLSVDGDVGDYAFMLSEKADVDIHGNAGRCCGHSFASGSILVHSSVGDCLAAYATGGFIAVHKHARFRCAMELSGADVFVRRSVGDEAGYCMRNGTLVLGNGAGANVGLGMTGGIIYIRGEVKSTAEHIRPSRMKDAEALRLSLFLARAGIKGGGEGFKVYRPANTANPRSKP